jgi:ribonucrease Y
MRVEAEQYARDHRQQITGIEQILTRREAALAEQLVKAEQSESEITRRSTVLAERERAVESAARRHVELVATQQRELERVSGLTADEARELLLRQIESDARRDAANLVKRLEAEAREQAAGTARSIITQAIQRSAAEHTIETTVSVVDLPSDDLKGRIIGREGRNIRALELATGVDLIVDDTPGAIILSGFDPYRREVARRVIERLIADGRIHPARIEEVVEKVKGEMEDAIRKDGEAAAFELGLHDLHPEVLRLMGRLQFRTSYGQNILHHSREVAYLAGIMARELAIDAGVAVRAAFLHDIGKAIDRDIQGSHLELGLDFLKKHGESDAVLQAVAAHHMDIDWPSLEAMIVQAADAVSAARPGARRDILESYVKRLEKLEGIADSFKGVSKSFALQAGREIRILVESEKISDEEAVWLSKDIARRIENELEYPGQIKVTVIRETRAVDYAK